MHVLILGAGGHAQVVADILLQMHEQDSKILPVGYLDDNPALTGQCFLGLPVLGTLADLHKIPHGGVVVAIGDNQVRRKLFDNVRDRNEYCIVARHRQAIIASDVQVGPGSMICAGVIVNPGSVVGSNVILNTGCTVDHHNCINDHAHIAPGVNLGGDVSIGEGTLVGIGAVVLPQRKVGDWTVVAAGSVLAKDIPHSQIRPVRMLQCVGRCSGSEYLGLGSRPRSRQQSGPARTWEYVWRSILFFPPHRESCAHKSNLLKRDLSFPWRQ